MNYANETCSTPIWGGQMPAAGEVYSAQPTATPVSVVVTVRDECNNVRTVTINVTIPANSLNLPTIAGVSICDGETATLVASPTTNAEAMPINCVWTTGSTTLSQGEAPLSIEVSPAVNTTYNVTATDQAGCTASRSVVVSVNHPTNNAFTQVVCEGYTWTNHGWSQTYTVSGDYTHDYTSVQGCPSTDTLHLTVYHNTNTEFTEQGCDSYTWTNHGWSQTYTVSGDYQHNYQTAEGCTSTDVLHLTINHNSNSTYNETACDNYTWNNHGWSQYYTVGGVYYHDYTSADGCPSTDVLNLTINHSGSGSFSVTECESFTWYGQNYSTTGDYQHHLTTSHGCDSLVTLHLTIINAYYTDLYDTVCYGASYTWYDNTYTGNGTHTHRLVSSEGCDSVLTLHLHQMPVVRVGIDETHDCKTGQYTLVASSINSDQYEWWSEPDNGEMASQSRENEITVTPLATTTYYVRAWAAGHEDCSVTTSRILDPVKMARAAIDAHPAYLTIDRTEWNATDRSGGADWKAWYVDGVYYGDGHHISDKIVPPIDSLSIVLIVGNEECADTARRTIPYVNAGLWVPNAFTPSQDDNSYFGAVGTGISNYKMWVYTREGLLVFYSDSMGDKWDGTHDGKKCPQGTYTYRILYSTVAEPESEMEEVGTVTLLR
jgi:gliding motility-associated-like protein